MTSSFLSAGILHSLPLYRHLVLPEDWRNHGMVNFSSSKSIPFCQLPHGMGLTNVGCWAFCIQLFMIE